MFSTLYEEETFVIRFRYDEAFVDEFGRGVESDELRIPAPRFDYLGPEQEKMAKEMGDLVYMISLAAIVVAAIMTMIAGGSFEGLWSLINAL